MRFAAILLLSLLLTSALARGADVESDFLKDRSRYRQLEGPAPDASYGKTMTVYEGRGRVMKIESEAQSAGQTVRWDWYFDAKGIALVSERVYLTVDENGKWLTMPVLETERRHWLRGEEAAKTPAEKKKMLRREARKLLDHYRVNIEAFKPVG